MPAASSVQEAGSSELQLSISQSVRLCPPACLPACLAASDVRSITAGRARTALLSGHAGRPGGRAGRHAGRHDRPRITSQPVTQAVTAGHALRPGRSRWASRPAAPDPCIQEARCRMPPPDAARECAGGWSQVGAQVLITPLRALGARRGCAVSRSETTVSRGG